MEGGFRTLAGMTTHRIATDLARPATRTGTLLGIWAHPDDEAYLSAALMFTARRAGQRVVVVTATRGELGTDDPATWPPDRLAATREREMAASLLADGWCNRAHRGPIRSTDVAPPQVSGS